MHTTCGETSERVASITHGLVTVLYLVMLLWHLKSTVTHWSRGE